MLCMADKNGVVEASVPGLADLARVELKDCEDALERLSSPDKYSRSQDFEGRRIEIADGGWLLLNYKKYRGKLVSEKIKEQNRLRQQKFREKKAEDERNASNAENNANNAHVSDYDYDYASDSDPRSRKKKKKSPYSSSFEAFWAAYPKQRSKGDANKAWVQMKKNGNWPGDDVVIGALKRLSVSPDWIAEGGKYVPYPGKWLRAAGWEDEPSAAAPLPAKPKTQYEKNMEIIKRKLQKAEQQPLKINGTSEVVR